MSENPCRVEILWFIPSCGFTHAPDDLLPGNVIPAVCPDGIDPEESQ